MIAIQSCKKSDYTCTCNYSGLGDCAFVCNKIYTENAEEIQKPVKSTNESYKKFINKIPKAKRFDSHSFNLNNKKIKSWFLKRYYRN